MTKKAALLETERPAKPCAACGEECAGERRVRDRSGRYYHRSCYREKVGPPVKPCAVCGWECAERPRVRDSLGRYFHNACYEKAKRRTRAKREAEARNAATPAAHAPQKLNGVRAKPAGVRSPRSPAPPPPSSSPPPAPAPSPPPPTPAPARSTDAGGVDQAYTKPIVLTVAGAAVFAITLLADAPPTQLARSIAGVVIALTVLGVFAVLGAVVVGMVAKTWVVDCGPMPLVLLRLAGIYAVVDAVAVVSLLAVPGAFGGFGLIAALIVPFGLTAWLFQLDSARIAVLALIAIALNLIAGLALVALAAAG